MTTTTTTTTIECASRRVMWQWRMLDMDLVCLVVFPLHHLPLDQVLRVPLVVRARIEDVLDFVLLVLVLLFVLI